MIGPKELAQYALLVLRQVEKLSPYERAEVLVVAGSIAQAEINRDIRRRQDPGAFVEDE
jgi:uncharacterized protein with ACT and thioredoxin-like domain